MHPNIPDEVRWLVHEYLPTMEHIDLLLYLVRQDAVPKTLAESCAAVSITPDMAARRMRELVASGLVATDSSLTGDVRYQYRPSGLKQRTAVLALVETYDVRPVSLIRFVYERPPEAIQRFADAFRLRKPGR